MTTTAKIMLLVGAYVLVTLMFMGAAPPPTGGLKSLIALWMHGGVTAIWIFLGFAPAPQQPTPLQPTARSPEQ